MGTSAASVIDAQIHQNIGDFIEVAVTTALTTSNDVVSTNLNEYDEGKDDFFNGRWCYITNYVAAGEDRKIYDYATSGGTLDVRGANFTSDSSDLATVRVYRHSFTATQRAINDAIRELSDHLFRYIEDKTLVTGNILPDASFEEWTTDTALTWYGTESNVTLAKTSTAALFRNGSFSVKSTAGAANAYYGISSDNHPKLLDLQGKTVSLYCWAYPQTANDAYIVIYTLKNDGTTTQTLTSDTTCAAGVWTLLKLENQTLNGDLEEIQIRYKVGTSGQYAYFDDARLFGVNIDEYLLPETLRDGGIYQTYVQASSGAGSSSNEYSDDIMPRDWTPIYNTSILEDGTYRYLKIPGTVDGRRIRLIGTSPLTALSTYSGTTEVSGKQVELLAAYACYCLFRNEMGVASSSDTKRLEERRNYWWGIAHDLMRTHAMAKPKRFMSLPSY